MSCILSISGPDLDIDELIRVTALRPYLKKKKGEPRFKTKPDGEKMPHSVISLLVSDAGFEQLEQQITDAISYFEQHHEKLALLANVSGIAHKELDFGVNSQVNEDEKLYQTFRLPARLLKLVGEADVDIHLSAYSLKMGYVLQEKSKRRQIN